MALVMVEVDKHVAKRRPMLTLRPGGQIRLNSEATEIAREHNLTRVKIYWDKERRRIYLEPAGNGDTQTYKISYDAKQRSAATIGAKNLVRLPGLEGLNEPVQLSVEWSENDGMLMAKWPRGKK